MLVELIVSLFGIVFVHRNLSLLEKLEVLSPLKIKVLFAFLLLPYVFNLFFKELFTFVLIYIGIILITLIVFDKIIAYFMQKTFEKLHLQVIERLNLLLKTGKSPQTCTKILFDDLSSWEKATFAPLNMIFEIKIVPIDHFNTINHINLFYFNELSAILRSSSHVSEQLKAFYHALRLHFNLKQRSAMATQQVKAQALVCCFLYLGFLFLSTQYLGLNLNSITTALSLLLFISGQIIIFRIGGRIKWRT